MLTNKSGVTLIELVISLALLTILLTSIFLVYNVGVQIFLLGEKRSELRVDVERAMALMVDEILSARGITSASDRSVTLWIDEDVDQQMDSPELITYSFSGITGEALVRNDESGDRNLLRGVSDFSLTYDSEVVDTIHLVDFSLSATKGTESFTVATAVKLRNKPETVEEGATLIEE